MKSNIKFKKRNERATRYIDSKTTPLALEAFERRDDVLVYTTILTSSVDKEEIRETLIKLLTMFPLDKDTFYFSYHPRLHRKPADGKYPICGWVGHQSKLGRGSCLDKMWRRRKGDSKYAIFQGHGWNDGTYQPRNKNDSVAMRRFQTTIATGMTLDIDKGIDHELVDKLVSGKDLDDRLCTLRKYTTAIKSSTKNNRSEGIGKYHSFVRFTHGIHGYTCRDGDKNELYLTGERLNVSIVDFIADKFGLAFYDKEENPDGTLDPGAKDLNRLAFPDTKEDGIEVHWLNGEPYPIDDPELISYLTDKVYNYNVGRLNRPKVDPKDIKITGEEAQLSLEIAKFALSIAEPSGSGQHTALRNVALCAVEYNYKDIPSTIKALEDAYEQSPRSKDGAYGVDYVASNLCNKYSMESSLPDEEYARIEIDFPHRMKAALSELRKVGIYNKELWDAWYELKKEERVDYFDPTFFEEQQKKGVSVEIDFNPADQVHIFLRHFEDSCKRLGILEVPTGNGKSVSIMELMSAFKRRTLILVPSPRAVYMNAELRKKWGIIPPRNKYGMVEEFKEGGDPHLGDISRLRLATKEDVEQGRVTVEANCKNYDEMVKSQQLKSNYSASGEDGGDIDSFCKTCPFNALCKKDKDGYLKQRNDVLKRYKNGSIGLIAHLNSIYYAIQNNPGDYKPDMVVFDDTFTTRDTLNISQRQLLTLDRLFAKESPIFDTYNKTEHGCPVETFHLLEVMRDKEVDLTKLDIRNLSLLFRRLVEKIDSIQKKDGYFQKEKLDVNSLGVEDVEKVILVYEKILVHCINNPDYVRRLEKLGCELESVLSLIYVLKRAAIKGETVVINRYENHTEHGLEVGLHLFFRDPSMAMIYEEAGKALISSATIKYDDVEEYLKVTPDDYEAYKLNPPPASNINLIDVSMNGLSRTNLAKALDGIHIEDGKVVSESDGEKLAKCTPIVKLNEAINQILLSYDNPTFFTYKRENQAIRALRHHLGQPEVEIDSFFSDTRGSNKYVGKECLVFLGDIRPSLNSAEEESIIRLGFIDDDFVRREMSARTLEETIQAIGRFRHHLFPDRKFSLVTVGNSPSYDYLKDYLGYNYEVDKVLPTLINKPWTADLLTATIGSKNKTEVAKGVGISHNKLPQLDKAFFQKISRVSKLLEETFTVGAGKARNRQNSHSVKNKRGADENLTKSVSSVASDDRRPDRPPCLDLRVIFEGSIFVPSSITYRIQPGTEFLSSSLPGNLNQLFLQLLTTTTMTKTTINMGVGVLVSNCLLAWRMGVIGGKRSMTADKSNLSRQYRFIAEYTGLDLEEVRDCMGGMDADTWLSTFLKLDWGLLRNSDPDSDDPITSLVGSIRDYLFK